MRAGEASVAKRLTDVDEAEAKEDGRPKVRLGAVLPTRERLASKERVEEVLTECATEAVCDLDSREGRESTDQRESSDVWDQEADLERVEDDDQLDRVLPGTASTTVSGPRVSKSA